MVARLGAHLCHRDNACPRPAAHPAPPATPSHLPAGMEPQAGTAQGRTHHGSDGSRGWLWLPAWGCGAGRMHQGHSWQERSCAGCRPGLAGVVCGDTHRGRQLNIYITQCKHGPGTSDYASRLQTPSRGAARETPTMGMEHGRWGLGEGAEKGS